MQATTEAKSALSAHLAGSWPLRGRRARDHDVPPWLVWVYGALGVLALAYVVSLVVRRPQEQWPWLDSWATAAFEIVAALLCLGRARRGSDRVVPTLLGLAVLSWGLGDLVLAIESLGGASPSSPSVADIFWLCFYPLAYIGIVLLLRRSLAHVTEPNWLDGAVAGIGASAICAAFAFHGIVRATGQGAAATVTNLAYPVGDLLVLSVVVGGTALISGTRKAQWFTLAAAVAANVMGDTANLFQGMKPSHLGVALNDAAWPVSILLISLSVWLRPAAPDPLQARRVSGFLLPGAGAVLGFGVLVTGTLRSVSLVGLALAMATLVVVGIRLGLSARRLRVLTEENHRHAITDELTGLGNRRHLFSVLDRWFDTRSEGASIAFLFIDLNHFKEINDSFGHPAGDQLLAQLGPRLIAAVRGSDLVVRLGGDEFAVILLDADTAEASAVADRIVTALESPFLLQAMSASIGASIGVALAPSDAGDATELVWCADVAMYRAKLAGIPVAFYDPAVDGGENQLSLADELRAAVETGAFVLHYQPQLDLQSGRLIAVEALLRWPHPTLGTIPPLKFLPLAEEANLMKALTEWVLDAALAQCSLWRAAGSSLAVSVNISPTNLLDPDLPAIVRGLLDYHDVPPAALVLEITETSVISDFEGSQRAIERLRDLGVVVSIDDFGAGFTSLAHLSSLAVGELKLDRAFINGLAGAHKARDSELVRATIELGHAMGLRVVAEGIEDPETLALLRQLGCDLAQGYYIGRPVPADRLQLRSESPALTG